MSEETKTEAQEKSSAAPIQEPKKETEASTATAERPNENDGAEKEESREPRLRRRGRTKVSYLTINKIHHVDYKEIGMLKRFLTDRGKILPRRQSGNTAKQQRMITRAIKRARELALLPFVVNTATDDGMGRRTRRPD